MGNLKKGVLYLSTIVKDGLYEQRKLKLSLKKLNIEVLKKYTIFIRRKCVWTLTHEYVESLFGRIKLGSLELIAQD